jgi:hypothetical protein
MIPESANAINQPMQMIVRQERTFIEKVNFVDDYFQ